MLEPLGEFFHSSFYLADLPISIELGEYDYSGLIFSDKRNNSSEKRNNVIVFGQDVMCLTGIFTRTMELWNLTPT